MSTESAPKSPFIHPSAEIGNNVSIGEGTYIWNQVQLREGVTIGKKCILAKDVYVDLYVTIGDDVKVQNGVSIYNGVTIENEVFLGPHMTFTNDFYPRSFKSDYQIRLTLIRRGASIGANATIICGTTIGEYAMVAAGSVVTKDIPNHALVIGSPARVKGFVCKCGPRFEKIVKNADIIEMQCQNCDFVYRIPYDDFNKILPNYFKK